jgi:predicted Zn finger-like uncharacterized protein
MTHDFATESSSITGAAQTPAAGTCPLCHTVDRVVTHAALATGANWRCPRCSQTWDAERLAAAAAYSNDLATQ